MRSSFVLAACAVLGALASCSLISLDDYTRGAGGAAHGATASGTTGSSSATSSGSGGALPTSCGTFGAKKTLFPGPAAPTAIAVDHDAVYWIEQTTGFVKRVDKKTGAVLELLDGKKIDPAVVPLDIGLLPAEVVFVADGSSCEYLLWHVPKTMPPTGSPKLLYNGCEGGYQAGGFAVVANEIFVTTPGTFDTAGRIMTMTNLMQGADVLNSPSPAKTRPVVVAADAQWVYFTEQGKTSVSRIAKNGTMQSVIATNQGNVLHIEVDDAFLYWTSDAGRVLRLDKKKPGTPVSVAEGEPVPTDLASDASCLYWTGASAQGGVVHAVLKAGGTVVELAKQATGLPQSVAVDDEGVYWADGATGEIAMVPRL